MKPKMVKTRKEFHGEAVVGGIAIGEANVFGVHEISFPRYWLNDGELAIEIKRFYQALEASKKQLNQIKSKICRIQGQDQITILDSHILLLQDDLLVRSTVTTIERDRINAEWALERTIDEIKRAFSKMNQAYLQERKYDIDYIKNAVQRQLMGKSLDLYHVIRKGAIIVAHDLSPAETLYLVRYQAGGFITELGGSNSHKAVVARSLALPSLIGVSDIVRHINNKDTLVMDASNGRIIVNPTEDELRVFKKERNHYLSAQKRIKREAGQRAVTRDGHTVRIMANMELPDEADSIKMSGAHGIGLFRTEFLFLEREEVPTEKEQLQIYRKVLKSFSPEEVIFRTLDLGAEKLSYSSFNAEANPALGLRAIRFCMREKKLFIDQLRALIRSSVSGNLRICVPMIVSLDEFRKVKRMISDIIDEYRAKKIPHDHNIPLGIMIETPAAAMEIDLLAKEADFFCLGTNDLIQYLLAVDRTNEDVSYLYSPLHPSVLRLLQRIQETTAKCGKDITVCGEMAADPLYLLVLLGLGFDRWSMNAASIPRIKKMIRGSSFSMAQSMVSRLMTATTYKESRKMLLGRMKELYPEYFHAPHFMMNL